MGPQTLRIFGLGLGLAGWATAGQTLLECTADALAARGRVQASAETALTLEGRNSLALLQFRVSAIPGARVRRAVLLLHVPEGALPKDLRVGLFRQPWRERDGAPASAPLPAGAIQAVKEQPQRWYALLIDPATVQELVNGQAYALTLGTGGKLAFGARESLGYAPYLLVEWEAPQAGEPAGLGPR